ncbi:Wzz/FepE/Etk N-terminal domain-containing protein [uncultured Roseovarius sp.]|uniref:GumC family protein n=1 Tax=uncultured Roseovarius sp. TaxID=293344 RepID=UPI000C965FBC|nr:chain-length determining protein [Roseovarius sp.]|tara:strand:+ start:424 stop:1722 length:1299 start_codon:yes stop_codon:yes gene_type:complete
MSAIQSMPDLMRLLHRRLWLIALVGVIGAILSVLIALSQPKVFQATAVIQIESPQVGSDLAGQTIATDANHRLQLIEQRLMARDNLVKVIERHGLFANVHNMPLAEKVHQLRISARITPITVGIPGMGPATTPSGLSVTVNLNDPVKAAEVANDFVETVITQNRERRMDLVRETLDFFSTEEARVSAQIAEVEGVIADFKRANGASLPSSITPVREELRTLNETLLALDQQIIALETESTRQRQEVFARQIGQLTDQRALVSARIAANEAALAAAPRVERELGALTRNLTQLQDQLSTITTNRVEAEMASVLESRQQQERFEILETAIPPEFPVSASRKKLAIAGALASLVLGLALVITLELLNPAIRSAAQLEKELEITPVVTIPVVRLRHERRRRALRIAGTVLAVLLVVPLVLRLVQDRLIPLRLLGGN